MSSKKRIQRFLDRYQSKRTSFLAWELFIGFAISIAVFFNTDIELTSIDRFTKLIINSAMIIIVVGLSWLSMNNSFFKKYRIFNFLFLLVKITVIFYMVEYYGYGLNLFLFLIIPFEAFFTISEDFGTLLSLGLIIIFILKRGMGGRFIDDIALAWTFISLNFLFLILATFLMRDYHNDQLKNNLLERLQQSHFLLEEYARNVAEITVVEERNRIAREIHDSVGHYLTAVNLQIERATVYLDRDIEEVKIALQAAKLSSSEALRDVRSSVSMLREGEKLFDFKGEIEKLIKGFQKTYNVNFLYRGSHESYNHSVLLVLYRSLQEGLTNIQKHAQAKNISISFEFGNSTCKMILSDDGKGFDIQNKNIEDSYGLAGMKERIELIQGDIKIESSPNNGTTISIQAPVDPVMILSEGTKL